MCFIFPLFLFCFSAALEACGSQVSCSDPVQLWEAVLQTLGSSVYVPCVHKLLLIQWMLWLMQCQSERVLTLLMQTNHKVFIFYCFYKNYCKNYYVPLGRFLKLPGGPRLSGWEPLFYTSFASIYCMSNINIITVKQT